MIDTNVAGQRKLDELTALLGSVRFTAFEEKFLDNIKYCGLKYMMLSRSQKETLLEIYEEFTTRKFRSTADYEGM